MNDGAVFGKNMKSFHKSNDEDESRDSDVKTEASDSDNDIDFSSNNGDDVSAAIIDRGYTEEYNLIEEDLLF
jgi:hypothetical protein